MIYTRYGIKVRITGFNDHTYPISVSVESVENVGVDSVGSNPLVSSGLVWVNKEYPLYMLTADNGYGEIIESIKEICPNTNFFNNEMKGGL